jgi:hypothetical protein
VTRAIWDCLLEEFRCVKATFVLHNFMMMDMRTRRGSAACRRVPEEKSAGCFKHGAQQCRTGGNPSGSSSPPTSSKRVLFPGNTIDYTMHNQSLLRVIHIAITVFFHLRRYVNYSYSIPSFSPFDFYFSGEGAV